MIAELVGFLGTSVGGAIFGQVASFINKRGEQKAEREQREHERNIAIGGELREYYRMLNDSPDNPVKHSLGPTVWMLCATYCLCCLLCFCFPNEIVDTLDPREQARKVSVLFGLASWDLPPRGTVTLTTGGVGYGMTYPIVFILSAVCTGIVPRKLR